MARSVTTRATRRAALAALVGAGGPANGGKMRLTKANVPVTRNALLASFTAQIATYSGYAEVVPTWSAPGTRPTDGRTRVTGSRALYQPNAAVSEAIYNVYLANSGGTALVAAAQLAVPATFSTADDQAIITAALPYADAIDRGPVTVDLRTVANAERLTLDLLVAGSALLDGAKAHLYQAPVSLGPDMSLAAFAAVEADYDGYAAQSIVWGVSVVSPITGEASVSGASLLWSPNAAITPNDIVGVYVTNAGSSTLLFAYELDAQMHLEGVDSGFYDSPQVIWGT